MSAVETVKTFITALQSEDLGLAADHMTDDFEITGWTIQPIGKNEFLAVQSELNNAMPDFSYNLSNEHTSNDEVSALIRISGTHTQDLSLPTFGIPLIPYTGLAIDLPQVHAEFVIKSNKVSKMRVEPVAGGSLNGILQQLGTELPVRPRLGDSDITRLNESGDTSI
jgi:hypothetical protein